MSLCALIAAGGSSVRYGDRNKLFEPLGKTCVIVEAIKPFLNVADRVIVGINSSFADELFHALDLAKLQDDPRITVAIGGASRTETVKNMLSALPDDCDRVLVHDGARPFVSRELIERVLSPLGEYDAVQPTIPLTDSLVNISCGIDPVDRADFALVQTPLAAKRDVLKKAYKNAKSAVYDDISLIKTLDNVKIKQVEGDRKNIKITHKGDLSTPLYGCGYDIHRLAKGEGVTLCGTFIPCNFKAVAHSDGDVPVHAVMDSILSALGERDIGHLYPVDDPKYDGANSVELLKNVVRIAHEKGRKVNNASVCIIAEEPHIAPHISKMKAALAEALEVPSDRVGISATTNETVGDIGASKAIASFAAVSLI